MSHPLENICFFRLCKGIENNNGSSMGIFLAPLACQSPRWDTIQRLYITMYTKIQRGRQPPSLHPPTGNIFLLSATVRQPSCDMLHTELKKKPVAKSLLFSCNRNIFSIVWTLLACCRCWHSHISFCLSIYSLSLPLFHFGVDAIASFCSTRTMPFYPRSLFV